MILKKAIITAMKEEADLIINKFNLKLVKESETFKVFEWQRETEVGIDDIVLVCAGIGKVAATIWTSYIFENYQVEKLINIWIAGNLKDDEYMIGDVIMPNCIIQHDMYLPFEGEHLDYAKKPIFLENVADRNYDLNRFGLVLNGICITGDQFIDDPERVMELKNEYGADVCEMEAFAVLSVARENKALDKCYVIKAISDGANNEAREAHMSNLDFAMTNSIQVLELTL